MIKKCQFIILPPAYQSIHTQFVLSDTDRLYPHYFCMSDKSMYEIIAFIQTKMHSLLGWLRSGKK